MKRKILGWLMIITSASVIVLATLNIIMFNDFRFIIGIPVGIYMIFRFLPDARRKVKHESQTN